MSFNISQIVNSFLNVRNKVKNADGEWVDQTKPRETLKMDYQARVPGGMRVDVFEVWDKKVVIDQLEYGSTTNFYPLLWAYPEHVDESNFVNQLFVVATRTGGGSTAWPSVVSAQGSNILESHFYEEGRGTVQLKRPVILPSGGKLVFEGGSNDGESSYKVVWREIEG